MQNAKETTSYFCQVMMENLRIGEQMSNFAG